jgi:hypothetical protein
MTLRAGGPYRSDNANAESLFAGCYTEGAQGPEQHAQRVLTVGGPKSVPVVGARIYAHEGAPAAQDTFAIVSRTNGAIRTRFGAGDSVDGILTSFNSSIGGAGALALAFPSFYPTILHWTNWRGYYGTEVIPFQISMNGASASDAPWGTNRMNFPTGFGLGGRKVLSGTAAPASGAFNAGDMLFNSAPAAGGPMGWMCVTAGDPGTWKAMPNLAA